MMPNYRLIALLSICSFWLIGCGAIETEIEKSIYESTRSVGTRHSDAGKTYVHPLGNNSFRITYTIRANEYNRIYGVNPEKMQNLINYEAARATLKNGFTHFEDLGGGQTARENIIMSKKIIHCYCREKDEIPDSAVDAELFISTFKNSK